MPIPFKGMYAPSVALIVLTLFPQLINTAAFSSLADAMARDLHVPAAQLLQYPLFSEAAFAFGILIGTSLIRRYDVRKVFLLLLAADIAILTAFSFSHSAFQTLVLTVAMGLAGGMFLMVALPPLFMNFDERYFPVSAALMVPCLFGAATLAPIVCAPLADAGMWRPLFWGEAVVLLISFGLALLTVSPNDPAQKDAPVDWFALVMGAFATACVFAGTINASTHDWTFLPALVPFVVGVAGFVALVAVEYFKEKPLLPMRAMFVSFAVIGFVAAGAGNAIYIADVEVLNVITTRVLHLHPMQIAAAVWPLFALTVITGILFALILRTKWMPLFPLSGLAAICIGSGLLLANIHHPSPALQYGSIAAIGYGAGATVTPGLFMAGLSVPRDLVARGIAAIETVRLTIGFISGPLAEHSIVAHARYEPSVVHTIHSGTALAEPYRNAVSDLLLGVHATMAYVIGFAALAAIVMTGLLLKYYRRPHAPDLRRYVKDGRPAFESPGL